MNAKRLRLLREMTADQESDLQDELYAIKEVLGEAEDYLFSCEEPGTNVLGKLQKLAAKHTDLREAARAFEHGLSFITRGLNDISSALDELDDVVEKRTNELENPDDE